MLWLFLLTIFIILEVMLYLPKTFYVLGAFLLLISAVNLLSTIRKSGKNGQPFFNSKNTACFFSFLIFISGTQGLLLFLENFYLKQIALFLFVFMTGLFFLTLKRAYDFKLGSKQKYALENLIGYLNILNFYLMVSVLLFLNLNTNNKFLLYFVSFILVSSFLVYSTYKVYQIKLQKMLLSFLVVELILIQFFWAINFLPLTIYTQAGILSLIYYLLVCISRHHLLLGRQGFTARILLRYLVIAFLGILILLLTARWV